jgi:cell wall-associated NlpC family hydrolase
MATDVVALAKSYIGKVTYKNGPTSLDYSAAVQALHGLYADCSSFVQYIYKQAGVSLPRTAAEQYKATQTKTVSSNALEPGDLLFFGGWSNLSSGGYGGVQHVGIYAGNGMVVDEGGANANNVGTATLASYGTHFIAATRPLTTAATSTTGSTSTGSTSTGSIAGTTGTGGNVEDSNPLNSIPNAITGAAESIGSTFADIATFFGIVLFALILIVGGIMLLRPK